MRVSNPEYLVLTLFEVWTFTSGSAMLSISIALNALSSHATCTAVFVAIAAIIGFMFSSIQTLARISGLAWVGATCIITSGMPFTETICWLFSKSLLVFIVTVAVGTQGRPPPSAGVGVKSDYKLFGNPSFLEAMTAISTVCLSYAGTPAFFNIVAEMRDPRLYNRSLAICQSIITVVFIVVGSVVYFYCGSYVSSPALGSAGPTIKKISYGIALPGLLVSEIVLLHVSWNSDLNFNISLSRS